MLILAKAVLALMIGFILATFIGFILVPVLRKMKVGQRISIYLSAHKGKAGTPTMGGLIFILSTVITMLVLIALGKIDFSYNLLIVMFVFVSYACIGFIDDFISIKRNNNVGLTAIQKLLLQVVVALVFFFLYMKGGGDPTLEIYTLNIKIDMGWFYGFFLLFVLVGASNAVNITDGLDGLAGGLSAIAFLSFGLISWGADWTQGNQEIAILCFLHPARVQEVHL
jgi:phospho-N-acetylmuramoyl-pentapeptide-transferase